MLKGSNGVNTYSYRAQKLTKVSEYEFCKFALYTHHIKYNFFHFLLIFFSKYTFKKVSSNKNTDIIKMKAKVKNLGFPGNESGEQIMFLCSTLIASFLQRC